MELNIGWSEIQWVIFGGSRAFSKSSGESIISILNADAGLELIFIISYAIPRDTWTHDERNGTIHSSTRAVKQYHNWWRKLFTIELYYIERLNTNQFF